MLQKSCNSDCAEDFYIVTCQWRNEGPRQPSYAGGGGGGGMGDTYPDPDGTVAVHSWHSHGRLQNKKKQTE